MADTGKKSNTLVIILVLAIVAVAAYAFTHSADHRTTGERLDDAGEKLSHGDLGGAAGQLGDRTPAQKVGDAVENTGKEIQEQGEKH